MNRGAGRRPVATPRPIAAARIALAAAIAAALSSACATGRSADAGADAIAPLAPAVRPAEYGPRPLRVGHRGAAGLAPQNTMASFRAGIAAGVDAVELDVHLSADGRLVVIHDPAVNATTDGKGRVSAMSLAELRALDASARFTGWAGEAQRIPTLEEVLDLLAEPGNERIGLQLEIKLDDDGSRHPGIEAAAMAALRERGLVDRTIVISFDFTTLAAVKALEPRIRAGALVGKAWFKASSGSRADQAAAIAASGADCAGVDHRYLSRELYDALRAAGLGVGAWTVDDPAVMKALSSLGVDFITSNRPDLLAAALP